MGRLGNSGQQNAEKFFFSFFFLLICFVCGYMAMGVGVCVWMWGCVRVVFVFVFNVCFHYLYVLFSKKLINVIIILYRPTPLD